jgi:hypothetical protein
MQPNALRSHQPKKPKPSRIGITGKDNDNSLYPQQKKKLFKSIVENAAGITYKKEHGLLVHERYINPTTRGTAVAIGPLEYCGSGIPMSRPRGKGVRSNTELEGGEKNKIL